MNGKQYDLQDRALSKKGFTLVETVVVMLLLAMLSAGGAGAVIGYRHQAEFRRNNEYAKTLFTAAQSYLSKAKSGGMLGELAAELEELLDAKVTQETVGDDPKNAGETLHHAPDGLYKLEWTTEDFRMQRWKTQGTAANLFYRIFREYLYDRELLNAAVCLEFDPAEGTVCSVSYSSHADAFTYAAASSGSTMSIYDRRETIRRKILLGYYSSGIQRTVEMPEETVPEVTEIWMVNDETLELHFTVSSEGGRSFHNSFLYNVSLFKEEAPDTPWAVLSFKDEYEPSTGESFWKLPVQVKFQDGTFADLDFWIWKKQPEPLNENLWEMVLTLDAADGEAARILEASSGAGSEAYRLTYSIRRLGLTQENIWAGVQVTNEANSFYSGSLAMLPADKTNAMMAKAGGTRKEISNARHLFNLRFLEASRGTDVAAEYLVTQPFGWAGGSGPAEKNLLPDGKWFRGQTPVSYAPDTDPDALTPEEWKNFRFPPIAELKAGAVLKGASGGQTIAKLLLAAENAEERLGLFCTNRGTIEALTCAEPRAIGTDAAGAAVICAENYGTIGETAVTNGSITGTGNVGGIAGKNFAGGTIRDCTLDGTVSGTENVGGIAGYNAGTAETCQSILSTGVSAGTEERLQGTNVGGIAGYNDASGTILQCSVEGEVCGAVNVGGAAGYNSGTVTSGTDADGNPVVVRNRASVTGTDAVGGIIGCQAVGITEYMANDGAVSAAAGDAGGVVGVIGEIGEENEAPGFENEAGADESLVRISNCENYGTVTAQGVSSAGGIVGVNPAGSTIENCRNYGTVGASEGSGGGIAAKNCADGVIRDSGNYAGIEVGDGVLGGIVARNEGRIERAETKGLEGTPLVLTTRRVAGGIAGENTGDITECWFEGDVSASQEGVADTAIRAVGGIAGYNAGTVENIGEWLEDPALQDRQPESLSSSPINVLTEVTDAAVKIHTFVGDVGGIVGYNDQFTDEDGTVRRGVVRNCTTAKDWAVYAERYTENDGTGGIIGYNRSGAPVTDAENLALVMRNGLEYTASAVGGIVGYWAAPEQTEIKNAVNMGKISGPSRVGGILGQLTAHGITVTDCRNYGMIAVAAQQNNGKDGGTGGILGHIGAIAEEEISFDHCMNFGSITYSNGLHQNVSGILGGQETDQKIIYTFENCVNAAKIANAKNGNTAGISAISGKTSSVFIYNWCRNYGRAPREEGDNGVGSGTGAGIGCAENSEYHYCFAAANPIMQKNQGFSPMGVNKGRNDTSYVFPGAKQNQTPNDKILTLRPVPEGGYTLPELGNRWIPYDPNAVNLSWAHDPWRDYVTIDPALREYLDSVGKFGKESGGGSFEAENFTAEPARDSEPEQERIYEE